MYTEDRKSLGKLRILLESNREYYCIFQQTAHESGSYVCTEQTETALGQHLLDLLESSRELIGQIAARYHAIDDYLTRDYMDYEKIQGYLLFIQKLYQELANANIIWKSVLSNSPVFFPLSLVPVLCHQRIPAGLCASRRNRPPGAYASSLGSYPQIHSGRNYTV